MGWNVRRSKKIAPGIRLNLSKKGLGVSMGPKHSKISISPGKRITTNIGIPGTGVRYTKVINSKQQTRATQKVARGNSYEINGEEYVEINRPGSKSSYLMGISSMASGVAFIFFVVNLLASHYKNAFNSFVVVMVFAVFGGIFFAVRPKIAIKVDSDSQAPTGTE
ncbi:MAG: DUF4236 domain-containing protein [Actinobacteria bacterium]|nr:DUF4236 domain-containing protein [Actinomycetota bacterium]